MGTIEDLLAEIEGARGGKGGTAGRKRILVVDDDPAVLLTVREVLAGAGYDVDAAESGTEALLRLRRSRPDLVVLDINMPGLDGIDVCKRLRGRVAGSAAPAGRRIPILFLTGEATMEAVREAVAAGGDGYVVKPFVAADLLGRISVLLTHAPS